MWTIFKRANLMGDPPLTVQEAEDIVRRWRTPQGWVVPPVYSVRPETENERLRAAIQEALAITGATQKRAHTALCLIDGILRKGLR